MDRGAGGDRGPGEAARIGERLDDAGAQVEQRAGVDVDADALCGLRLRENPDRRAALAPLFRALLDLCEPGTPDRALQRAIADKLAVDAVFVDKRVDGRRAAAQEAEQPFAIIRAEPLRRCRRGASHMPALTRPTLRPAPPKPISTASSATTRAPA